MRAQTVEVKSSTGRVLCCTVFRPGGKKLLAKGHVISDEDVRVLESEGMESIWVTELEEGEVGEDDAVCQVASEMGCGSFEIRLAAGGRANLLATENCCVLVSAGRNDTPHARNALEKLCRSYWFPIYAFVRRQGHGPHDAKDLTQEFFARLLEKKQLAGADPAKGRFRSFLLASLKHFLANEWDKAKAQKRGGGQILIPIDVATAETSCGTEPADHLTAEKIFERRWALTLLDQVLRRLRAEYRSEEHTSELQSLRHLV